MKLPVIIFIISGLIPFFGKAQSFSPRWYGRAETKTKASYNSYLCELVIDKKGNQISGTLNYFFGQQEYGVKISGIYLPQTKTIELNPFSLISFFATGQNSPDCQVDGSLTLYTEDGDSILFGQINPVEKYRNMCPILTISLNNETLPKPGPDPDIAVISDKKDANQPHTVLTVLPPNGIASEPEPDSAHKVMAVGPVKIQALNTSAAINADKPLENMKEKVVPGMDFTKRTFMEGPLIYADADTITLHLYDNGQLDNDTVSVYFNREQVVFKQKLNVTPIIIKLVLQPGENEIAMFADNLGDIPPNTALCLIFAGGKRYHINMESNLAANGTVRIKRRSDLP